AWATSPASTPPEREHSIASEPSSATTRPTNSSPAEPPRATTNSSSTPSTTSTDLPPANTDRDIWSRRGDVRRGAPEPIPAIPHGRRQPAHNQEARSAPPDHP